MANDVLGNSATVHFKDGRKVEFKKGRWNVKVTYGASTVTIKDSSGGSTTYPLADVDRVETTKPG